MITLVNPLSNTETISKIDFKTPPIGLAYLASVLRENSYKVRIVDNVVEKLSLNELVKKIKNSAVVGITTTTPTFNTALKYAKKIKSALENVFVILGGIHVSFMPYSALKHEYVDAVCIGEGEYTLLEAVERLDKEKSLEGVRGLIYKENGRIIDNGKREFIQNLDELPFPAYDLLPLEKYSVLGQKLEHFPMMSSRGCPFGCRYCASSLFMGRRFRARSAENVVDEIEWLQDKFGARYVGFGDDTFTLNKKRVLKICEEIKRRGLDVEWSCSSRVDTIDGETIKKMKSAGCNCIYYGVESANQKILNEYYRKRISLEQVKDAVKKTKEHGILTVCSFIIGAPMETREDMMKTLKFSIKLNPDYAQYSILTPYPGTEIYKEAKEKGWLLTENFDEYTCGKPVLKNFYLTPKEISRFLRYCYMRFYLRPKFIWKEIKNKNIKIAFEIVKRLLFRRGGENG
ncbi:B12-binding domain-containing radical SAM protein [Archaeoglobus profundus]|uniref:Radical SAM domain protein n=1 Tax=Archaeoglobus profundus (strain DSM 5631 / JCM 9629 / NBRC 100127 / Av18) TaxID=572546 RepID=D2RHE6_ARCPA|nr:radical SAM protein [Archaeoglobus profundus]ADB57721.1 Radical SAM domain protein [Archaeoglobus profundus DSM 5631]